MQQPQGGGVVGDGALGRGRQRAVGLVDHEHIGHLEQAPLDALQVVAAGGSGDSQHRVADVGHARLGLAHPHGLHEDHVEAGSLDHLGGLQRRSGHATQRRAGR